MPNASESCGMDDVAFLNAVADTFDHIHAAKQRVLDNWHFEYCVPDGIGAHGSRASDLALPDAFDAASKLLAVLPDADINPADFRTVAQHMQALASGGAPPHESPKSSGPADDVEWLNVTAQWLVDTVFPPADALADSANNLLIATEHDGASELFHCHGLGPVNEDRAHAFINAVQELPAAIGALKAQIDCLHDVAAHMTSLRAHASRILGRSEVTKIQRIAPTTPSSRVNAVNAIASINKHLVDAVAPPPIAAGIDPLVPIQIPVQTPLPLPQGPWSGGPAKAPETPDAPMQDASSSFVPNIDIPNGRGAPGVDRTVPVPSPPLQQNDVGPPLISVRYDAPAAAESEEHEPSVWPWVVGGALAVGGIVFLATRPRPTIVSSKPTTFTRS